MSRDTFQAPLEVYDAVQALVAPTPVEGGGSALGVAPSRAGLALCEGLEGPALPQGASIGDDTPPHACSHQSINQSIS